MMSTSLFEQTIVFVVAVVTLGGSSLNNIASAADCDTLDLNGMLNKCCRLEDTDTAGIQECGIACADSEVCNGIVDNSTETCQMDACSGHIVAPGNTENLDTKPIQCLADTEKAAVRCCSDTPLEPLDTSRGWNKAAGCDVWASSDKLLPTWTRPSGKYCQSDKTFAEAVDWCAQAPGARVCTLEEILGDCTAGCGFNKEYIWTLSTTVKGQVCQDLPPPASTLSPTLSPTSSPTPSPTVSPTLSPTSSPTPSPTVSPVTSAPTTSKPTKIPSIAPTSRPSVTRFPTMAPIESTTMAPIESTTTGPSAATTLVPTTQPTREPTSSPTSLPTPRPTSRPTPLPTPGPTPSPTVAPSTVAPTPAGYTYPPSKSPTTSLPTASPVVTMTTTKFNSIRVVTTPQTTTRVNVTGAGGSANSELAVSWIVAIVGILICLILIVVVFVIVSRNQHQNKKGDVPKGHPVTKSTVSIRRHYATADINNPTYAKLNTGYAHLKVQQAKRPVVLPRGVSANGYENPIPSPKFTEALFEPDHTMGDVDYETLQHNSANTFQVHNLSAGNTGQPRSIHGPNENYTSRDGGLYPPLKSEPTDYADPSVVENQTTFLDSDLDSEGYVAHDSQDGVSETTKQSTYALPDDDVSVVKPNKSNTQTANTTTYAMPLSADTTNSLAKGQRNPTLFANDYARNPMIYKPQQQTQRHESTSTNGYAEPMLQNPDYAEADEMVSKNSLATNKTFALMHESQHVGRPLSEVEYAEVEYADPDELDSNQREQPDLPDYADANDLQSATGHTSTTTTTTAADTIIYRSTGSVTQPGTVTVEYAVPVRKGGLSPEYKTAPDFIGNEQVSQPMYTTVDNGNVDSSNDGATLASLSNLGPGNRTASATSTTSTRNVEEEVTAAKDYMGVTYVEHNPTSRNNSSYSESRQASHNPQHTYVSNNPQQSEDGYGIPQDTPNPARLSKGYGLVQDGLFQDGFDPEYDTPTPVLEL